MPDSCAREIAAWVLVKCNGQELVQVNSLTSILPEWQNVTSGIPQGSVSGPLLFLAYINDLMECCDESYIYVFADDAKIYRHIQCPDDFKLLQYTLARLQSWSQKWLLSLNTKKFAVGRSVDKTVTYTLADHSNQEVVLERYDKVWGVV